MASTYAEDFDLPWSILLDSQQLLYRAYGMTRGSWWSIYGIPSIWKYLKLIFSGTRPGKPGRDWRQLGGNILIDPDGIVRVHHISTSPHDRPTVDELLRPIEEFQG